MPMTRIRRFVLSEDARIALATESAKTGIPMEALAGSAVILAMCLKGLARKEWHETAVLVNRSKLAELKADSHK